MRLWFQFLSLFLLKIGTGEAEKKIHRLGMIFIENPALNVRILGLTCRRMGRCKKPPETCPQCGDEWIKDPEFFKCEKCKLITTNPDWVEETENN